MRAAIHAGDAGRLREFSLAVFRKQFTAGLSLTDPEMLLAIAGECGLDRDEVKQAMADESTKARLRAATDAAIAAGVTGIPAVRVEGALFWGMTSWRTPLPRRDPDNAAMPVPSLPREFQLTGTCLCGGVRYELAEPPRFAYYCHCTRCQRRTGTAASAQAAVNGDAFCLTQGEGLVKGWRHPDGGFEKLFCRECGAHLFSRDPADPAKMTIRMSAFDADPGVRPSVRVYCAHAASW